MEFAQSLQITANSAISTLAILDRQARKDTAKIIRFTYGCYILATCPQAMQTYRSIWQLCEIIWLILVWLFSLLCEWSDRQVAQHLPQETAQQEPIEVSPIESIEPVAEAQTEAVEEAIEQVEEVEAIDLTRLGIRELRKMYTSRKLKGLKTSHATRSQLISALSAAG